MAIKQSTAPIAYQMSIRSDDASGITSIKAGVAAPITVFPLHRGESCSGNIMLDMALAEMPAPLENAVLGRVQAWFVPRPALPQFSGLDEYTHSFHGTDITALGGAARTPPALFSTVGTGAIAAAQTSEFFATLGISLQPNTAINTDYIDAYNLIQNFRLAAHSSKLTRYDYYAEDPVTALEHKPAFWPRNRMHQIVPDYEQALVRGSLDLDVITGTVNVSGLYRSSSNPANANLRDVNDPAVATGVTPAAQLYARVVSTATDAALAEAISVDMGGTDITVSLNDIDKARTTNAFAKAVAKMDGSNYSGFNNDDVLMAELMQGYVVPDELFNRPWLISSQTIVFGMVERHATDAANLEDSVVTGAASVTVPINIPTAHYGGVGIVTVEVMPERLYERQADEYLYCLDADDLPNAMRDSLRVEPVDTVPNRRIDTLHTTPNATYGFEPMNAKWRRERTFLGGEFRQLTPGTPSTNSRTQIWQADYVDPVYTSDAWLCPHPFPQDVFSVPANDICNIGITQRLAIVTNIQFGDDLVEDNGEFLAVSAERTA